MITNLKFRISRDAIFGDELWLRFWGKSDDGDIYVPEPIVFKKHKPDLVMTTAYQADMAMTPTSAQQLMDELWHVGLRPTEGTGSAGSLAATQRHLSDMRAIVGKQLKVELPK